VLAVVIVQPPLVLFLMSLSYAVSGPVLTLVYLRRRRAKRKSAVSGGDEKTTGNPDA